MQSLESDQRANRLLACLEPATRAAVAPRLEHVPLVLRQNLYEEDGPMTDVWFPAAGVLSMLAATSAAQTRIEVATIGPDGMLGVPLLLGGRRSPGVVFAQVEGHGWRMGADDFLDAVRNYADFAGVMQRYACALLVQVSQGTACNRAHDVAQRCARWLLQTHDRVAGDTLELTQEFLAEMLGERRATVNQAATALQQRGLIRYSRGRITVTDRPGLEAAACGCYRFIRDQTAQLLPLPPASHSDGA
ncbi:Crp/Fnr family transcriptional regulator [Ramlibacter ginsenosidimutans]|uniref:Crp/Fnr family transcriptional regulator n=1 Tax=Ramlibacter ginsenosidimutans TaxID=502333 RepID=A0A934TQ92_9BURK|nr:Crp/Fnr family transcriptional regulator [Ramlibacter ginsenosidimutans]MBK6004966.1 Crp/Fnr family transcriptional regulator [Ramlibacter ginsenosidimutans]